MERHSIVIEDDFNTRNIASLGTDNCKITQAKTNWYCTKPKK